MRSFTYEQVKEYVESKGCILLSTEYFKCQDNLEFIGTCGHKYCVPFERFKHHKQYECPSCGNKRTGLKKRLTYDYVYNYIKDNGCQLLSISYEGSNKKLDILFKCGHTGKRTFEDFKTSTFICSRCANTMKYDIKEIKEKLLSYGYIVDEDEEYIDANTKLSFNDLDGYKYHYSFHCVDSAYKRGFKVTDPFELSNKYALDNIQLWIIKNNKPYTMFCEKYKGSHISNMVFNCSICNTSWKTAWSNVYSTNTGCPTCAINKNAERKRRMAATETYNLKILKPELALEWDYNKNIYLPEEISPQSSLKAFWECSICGYKWGSVVSSRYKGIGCPACALSSNEQVAYKFFKNNNLNFEIEYEFEDLKSYYDNPLRYDFAILNNDNTIKMLLEIDSKLHDEYIPFFHNSIEEFNIRMQYDEMKDKYAKDHNYKLLRIKEKDFNNIESILAKELNL
jgi:transcription elongation factor Elf1/DNA-directed RNA polymerase subunit RPC12/RpoP